MVGPFHGGAFRNGPANAGYLGIWWTFHREFKYPPAHLRSLPRLSDTDGSRGPGDGRRDGEDGRLSAACQGK